MDGTVRLTRRRGSDRAALLVVATCALIVPAAGAQQVQSFARGTFTLNWAAGYAHGFHEVVDVGSAQVGANYFVFDNFSLGAEVAAYGVAQPGDNALAVGLEGVVRHHLFRWAGTTVFIDASFGPFEASEDVPPGGTRFNFVTRAGLGGTYRLDERLHLMLGARYWHLSNARIEGVERNPGVNGVEVYCGLMWEM